jgi:hypothetical protein
MSGASVDIPYEKQVDPGANRGCGAACLSMVYRSLGQEVAQAEIWPAIARENRYGSIASTTHLMAKDALGRGFAALAFQARQPLPSLRLCRQLGIRAILNHRLNPELPTGHYTVLVDVDDKDVVLHDPFYGPVRRVPHAELLELWQPRFANSEIAGYMLIAIAAEPSAEKACWLCRTPLPPAVACPKCKEPVSLQPCGALRCINTSCVARMWNYLCCPSCDNLWTFSAGTSAAEGVADEKDAARPGGTPPNEALDFTPLFAELDKFSNLVLSLPAAANNPDIKRYTEALAARKEDLKQSQAVALQNLKAHKEQLAKLVQEAAEKQEAHRKKMEEVNKPSPPLDPNALGRALMKNLGWGQ